MKGHNSGTIAQKNMCNNPDIDLVNMNAYIFNLVKVCPFVLKIYFGVNQQAITFVQKYEK